MFRWVSKRSVFVLSVVKKIFKKVKTPVAEPSAVSVSAPDSSTKEADMELGTMGTKKSRGKNHLKISRTGGGSGLNV